MEHDLRRRLRERARDGAAVADVHRATVHPLPDAGRREQRPAPGRARRETGHVGAQRLQPQRQPGALEAGVAGDQAPAAARQKSGSIATGAGIFTQSPSCPHAIPPSPPPPAPPERAPILELPLAISDYEEVMDWMQAMIAADARGYVTAAAVNLVMSAREDPETRAAVLGATLAVPDGQPLVWALRALGHGRATRIYGPDLMALFCARAARDGTPVYLYGGRTPRRSSSWNGACSSASRACRSPAGIRRRFAR